MAGIRTRFLAEVLARAVGDLLAWGSMDLAGMPGLRWGSLGRGVLKECDV